MAQTKKSLAIDAPERRRLPILLRHAWYGLNQTFRRRIAHTGVTPDQFTTMRTLMENETEGLTQSRLTELMASDPNTIASLIERMEKAGWLTRTPHEKDRRAYRLHVQPLGRKKYQQVREIALTLQSELFTGWTATRREQFLENLAQLAENCRAASDKNT